MLKKDYLQRKIEEFGKALAFLVSKKKQIEFEKELMVLAQTHLQVQLDGIITMNEDEFVEHYIRTPKPDRIVTKLTADVLYETLLHRLESFQGENIPVLIRKCSLLYSYLLEDLTENEYDLGIHYRLKMLDSIRNSQEELN